MILVRDRRALSYTTAELIACERAIVEAAAGARGTGKAMLARRNVERTLTRRPVALTDEQRRALVAVAQSGHGVESIEALAGTGKTHLAGALATVY